MIMKASRIFYCGHLDLGCVHCKCFIVATWIWDVHIANVSSPAYIKAFIPQKSGESLFSLVLCLACIGLSVQYRLKVLIA